jgi:hypothetical protein
MADVQITVRLPAELVEEADELGLLSDEMIAKLLQSEVERRLSETDEDDDTPDEVILAHLREAFVDALAGNNLRPAREVMDELRRELEADDDES